MSPKDPFATIPSRNDKPEFKFLSNGVLRTEDILSKYQFEETRNFATKEKVKRLANLEPRFYKISQANRLGEVLKALVDHKRSLPRHLQVRDDKIELAKLNRLEKDLSGSVKLLEIEPVADTFENETDREFNHLMTI